MAAKKGQLVFGTLVTPAASSFPIVDSNDVGGGRHFVDSITERNSIPASHRKTGMVVYVGGSVKKDYILKAGAPTSGNTTDANWEEYAPGVPAGVLTEHQKVEQMQYQTPYAPGKTTLLQKIEDLENAIASKLSTHQKVEDILYNDPTASGFNSLIKKLQDMDNKITIASGAVYIESVNWQNTPSDLHQHKANLGDEIESIWTEMNDPTKIKVIDGATSQKVTLQNKIAALENKLPYADQISMSSTDSTKITSYLTNSANAINTIKYDTTQTLKAKIDSIAATAGSPTIETIKWSTAPSGTGRNVNLSTELNTLFTNIADMNDPTKITIPATIIGTSGDKNLNETITELKSLISAASGVPTVELIKWNNTQTGTGRNQNLSDEINYLFTKVNDLSNSDNINVPATVMGTAGTLSSVLNTLKGLIDANTTAIGDSSSGLTKDVADLKTAVGDSNSGLVKDMADVKASIGNASSGLTQRVANLETTVGDSSSGLVKDTNDVKTAVGDSNSGLVKDVNDLKTTVGNSTSGLVKDTNDIKSTVGDTNSGLVKDVNDLKNSIGTTSGLTQRVVDLETAVGNSTTGLVKDTNDIKTTVGDSSSGLVKDVNDVKTAIGDASSGLTKRVADLETTVGDSTSGLVKDVDDLKTASADFAKKDASNITVSSNTDGSSTGNLNTVLQSLFTALGNVSIPQILLFNTSSPAVGALVSQEFLTNQKVKVKDIAIYTNVDATIAAAISAKLEYCAAGGTAYTDLDSNTAITLAAGSKQNSVDLSSANVVVNAGSRLRLNITAFDSSNTVDVLNVRVILEPTA